MVYWVGEVFQISSDVRLYFVDILCTPVYISWCLLWVLDTNSSFWSILLSFVVPDSLCLQDCDFSIKFVPWIFCCLGYISVHPCKWFHFAPKLGHLLSLNLVPLYALLCYFFIFPLIDLSFLLSCSFLALLFLLLFFLSKVLPSTFEHLYYPPLYPPGLFLTRYLPLCLSFQVCVVI